MKIRFKTGVTRVRLSVRKGDDLFVLSNEYAKLPRGFHVPTPVGNYNPDWAIAFRTGSVKHMYFVAETKGTLESLELRGVEEAKIACARKFFGSLEGGEVRYDVVTGFDRLMDLVA